MGNSPNNLDSVWQGLEPEQPKPARSVFFVALAAALFLLLGLIILGYLILQLQNSADPSPQTSETAGTPAAALVPTAGNEDVDIAATMTLPPTPDAAAALTQAEFSAARLLSPLVIDASPADWLSLPVYSSPHPVYRDTNWDGTDDLNPSWQIAWDNTQLYLVATIEDDIHVQTQSGQTAFRGDSVELQIDTELDQDWGTGLSPDDFQISLSPGNFADIPPSAWRFQGRANGEMLDAPTPHTIVVAAEKSANGYILETAIPWRDLNLTPSIGLVIGLAVNFNDNDKPGTAVQEIMKSSAPYRRFGDPNTWGTLRLD